MKDNTGSSGGELYVSLEPEEYRENKANILSSEADVLNIMKHQKKIMKLRQEKVRLKDELHRLFSEVFGKLGELGESMPSPKAPKLINGFKVKPLPEENEADENQTIDDELMEIQNKLQELNS